MGDQPHESFHALALELASAAGFRIESRVTVPSATSMKRPSFWKPSKALCDETAPFWSVSVFNSRAPIFRHQRN